MTDYEVFADYFGLDDTIEVPDDAVGVTVLPTSGMLNNGVWVRYLYPVEFENDSKGGPDE